ncbi:MAG TPA: SAM-dependent chlorinase/fluorinase [Candidatus Melainabacteria bacterium]|nr:SAM-dependent chlorinase/fluorinase [Candidatus Melainabacteria bacterium]
MSSSFHARDIFGPVAAHLSLGIEPHKFGPELDHKSLNVSAYRPAAISSSNIAGEVIYIDRFGNLITNIPNSAIPQAISSGWKLNVTNEVIDEISLTYSSVPEGALLAFEGSNGFI